MRSSCGRLPFRSCTLLPSSSSSSGASRADDDILRKLEALRTSQQSLAPDVKSSRRVRLAGSFEKKQSKKSGAVSSAPKKTSPTARRQQQQVVRSAISTALISFCEGCQRAGLPSLALDKLGFYRRKWSQTLEAEPFGDPELYAAFLALAASERSPRTCLAVLEMIRADSLEVDLVCLVQALRCLGRAGNNQEHEAALLADSLREAGGEKLLDEVAVYAATKESLQGEREIVEGIGRAFKNRSLPVTEDVSDRYDCELLEDLNARCTDDLSPLLSQCPAELDSLIHRQMDIEESGLVQIPSVLSSGNAGEDKFHLWGETLIKDWREKLLESVDDRIRHHLTVRAAMPETPMTVYPFFKVLAPEDYVSIIIQELRKLLQMSETFSQSVTSVQANIGGEVLDKINVRVKTADDDTKAKFISIYQNYLQWFFNPRSTSDWCPRTAFQRSSQRTYVYEAVTWPFPVRLAVGRELLNTIMNRITVTLDGEGHLVVGDMKIFSLKNGELRIEAADVDRSHNTVCPAFFKVFRARKSMHEIEELKPLPILAKLFAHDKFSVLAFDSRDLPMVVPPLPWTSSSQGGYLMRTSTFKRVTRDSRSENSRQPVSKLLPIFDALNQLGATPWKINQPILDLVVDVFVNQDEYESYLSRLGIPRRQDRIVFPQLDPDLQMQIDRSSINSAEDIKRYNKFLAEREAFKQFKAESHSLWCDMLYRISIAHHFKRDVLYFPHNLDFRGRVYPIAPYLNHMGADLARSLLVFAEGKPLGEKGLQWLKLHAVNLTGLKKREPVQARLDFAEEILDDILDSANDPMGGRKWWLESEEPWQTLGVCLEIRDALNSGDPSSYISHLPVHQDGSCNGLQHYAALGRDVLGGRSVNVLPSDVPQDVYSEIAAIVEKKRAEDAANGVTIAQVLEGFVYRKVIKQTVMTTVYGVTRFGAKLQIERQLKDNERFPLEEVDEASRYLAKKTFESLNEMFHASKKIQAWFTECAHALSSEPLSKTVEWTTPLGLVVNQPYVKIIRDPKGGDELGAIDVFNFTSFGINTKPNTMKQCNGFPPNFVHSLDSTHMMLTSLYMWNYGYTFASVHDCYWTHACTVDQMNKICREQFVRLHMRPILEELSEEFIRKLESLKITSETEKAKARMLFKAMPPKGELDLDEVRKSIYFFS